LTFSQRFEEIRTGFEPSFWVANITEIFERLAYYGAFASLALYLQEQLNFSTEQTGTLTGIFGGMVWFLAIFGGAAADRLGFRRALSIAYLILGASYFLIGSIGASWLAPVRNAVPLGLFVGFILILPALGVSLVKPCVVGTTARASKENVRSIGYSIYYTMVNIGGAAGPFFASWAHRHLGVENVYRVVALGVFAMFFVILLFFREPRKAGDAPPPSIATVARNFCIVLGNYRLVLPVLLAALLLRIALWVKPQWAVPSWIWVAFLVLMLAGISRFMWFLVIFTGYWIVFWQQYTSLARLHSRVHQLPRRRRDDSSGRRAHRNLSHPGSKFPDPQGAGVCRRYFGHRDYIAVLAHPCFPANHLGRGLLAVFPGARRDYPGAALLRIHLATRPSGAARHIHGIRLRPHRNRIAHRRPVRRIPSPSLW
jgi:dipeptide/tripeptide permease